MNGFTYSQNGEDEVRECENAQSAVQASCTLVTVPAAGSQGHLAP